MAAPECIIRSATHFVIQKRYIYFLAVQHAVISEQFINNEPRIKLSLISCVIRNKGPMFLLVVRACTNGPVWRHKNRSHTSPRLVFSDNTPPGQVLTPPSGRLAQLRHCSRLAATLHHSSQRL